MIVVQGGAFSHENTSCSPEITQIRSNIGLCACGEPSLMQYNNLVSPGAVKLVYAQKRHERMRAGAMHSPELMVCAINRESPSQSVGYITAHVSGICRTAEDHVM